MKLKLCELRR